jgi:uncharacterized protein
MIFPLESLWDERRALGLAVAVVVGIAFGFVQERTGFGRAQKLVSQFYGHDMTVFKAMFSAIVTAMLGTVVLSGLGLLDLRAVEFNYPTYLWPMIAGGLLLGVGFIISGYCPGTSWVAAASGKLDGLVTVVGVALGGLAYAEVEPAMGGFPRSGKLGPLFLYQVLHLPRPLVAVIIAAIALAGFVGVTRIEQLVRARARHEHPQHDGRESSATLEPASKLRWLDQSEIRTQQALGPLLLMTAYVVGEWRLVAVQAGILFVTALSYRFGPYVLLYRLALKPLGIVKPDVRVDNPEPHRFANIFGSSVLSVAVYLLATRDATAGWILTWMVGILGGIAFFGWCAGCFMYYVLNRYGAGGFFARAPVDGTFPGVRPPKCGGA